jgi:hypothetical protein
MISLLSPTGNNNNGEQQARGSFLNVKEVLKPRLCATTPTHLNIKKPPMQRFLCISGPCLLRSSSSQQNDDSRFLVHGSIDKSTTSMPCSDLVLRVACFSTEGMASEYKHGHPPRLLGSSQARGMLKMPLPVLATANRRAMLASLYEVVHWELK